MNVVLIKEELDILHGYASNALKLISYVPFKKHILNDNSHINDEVIKWTEISDKHLDNSNSIHLISMAWKLGQLKNSDGYANETEFDVEITLEQWKALKEIAYDISHIANLLMVKLRPHHTIDIITIDIQPIVYDVCVYLHKHYLDFSNNYNLVNQECFFNK